MKWNKCYITNDKTYEGFERTMETHYPEIGLTFRFLQTLYCTKDYKKDKLPLEHRDRLLVCFHPMHRFGKLIDGDFLHVQEAVNYEMDLYKEKVLKMMEPLRLLS